MQYVMRNLNTIFYSNSFFILFKFCLVPFRYSLISVLRSYKFFFEKTYIGFALEKKTHIDSLPSKT